ncbi:hypothetical protein [Rhizobium sp. 60-20]|uniref:hypothetical protein n=1 Tax=Rhizobium sp. 60-20 TaxID=1895819 RepID=UPI0009297E04|nr:hypothetical protein [Rhizobium sp. 60-20]OJY66400.1 MAG: hypothetical protein BGP09_31205 [Rhizobium sp. 60-20]
MIPTPEMIEAAKAKGREIAGNQPGALVEAFAEVAEAGAIAALSLLPGDPVAVMWVDSTGCEHVTTDVERGKAAAISSGHEVHYLYAAPAPQPVSVKAKSLEWTVEKRHSFNIHIGRGLGLKYEAAVKAYSPGWIVTLGPTEVILDNADALEEDAKAAAQADYESRICSALSSPVEGGTEIPEGWQLVPNKLTMEMEKAGQAEAEECERIFGAAVARDIYSAMIASSPKPPVSSASSAEIESLRVENGEFRQALEKIANFTARCEHDGGFDREIGPIGCDLGDKCVCIGIHPIASGALQTGSFSFRDEAEVLPQDIINLVITAREAFDTGMLPDDESHALDKALEAFSSRVPYENEPSPALQQQEEGK